MDQNIAVSYTHLDVYKRQVLSVVFRSHKIYSHRFFGLPTLLLPAGLYLLADLRSRWSFNFLYVTLLRLKVKVTLRLWFEKRETASALAPVNNGSCALESFYKWIIYFLPF